MAGGGYTSVGLNEVQQNGHANFTHIGVGSSNQAFSESDTDLVSPIERIAIGGKTYNGAVVILEALFANDQGNPSGSDLVYEVGLFDAASGGNLLYRYVLGTGLAKDSSKPMTLSFPITLANA